MQPTARELELIEMAREHFYLGAGAVPEAQRHLLPEILVAVRRHCPHTMLERSAVRHCWRA